jgi:hypothetical protein
MATYKFPQFNVEIINPTIEVVNVADAIKAKTCSVDVLLSTPQSYFGVTLEGFTYVSDWNDAEVEVWTMVELSKYEI